jgi:hypothetical protein
MLKKSAAIILLQLYLVTATGFALNLHYCFNRVRSVTIDAPAKSCAKSLAASKMKCCHDKRIEVKVKDSHQPAAKSSVSKIFNEELLFMVTQNITFSLPSHYITVVSYRGPPRALGQQPVYLTNRNFRV